MEQWKAIPGTKGKIEISNTGRARSLLRGKPYILKTQTDNKGYERLRVTIDGVKYTYKIHRLVAAAFLPNSDNLPQVNHIDGNKHNNAVNNLEWISNADNCRHAINSGLWDSVQEGARQENERRRKPVIAYKEGDARRFRFASVSEAERYFNSRHITAVLKGKREHVKGYRFCYEGEVVRRASTNT